MNASALHPNSPIRSQPTKFSKQQFEGCKRLFLEIRPPKCPPCRHSVQLKQIGHRGFYLSIKNQHSCCSNHCSWTPLWYNFFQFLDLFLNRNCINSMLVKFITLTQIWTLPIELSAKVLQNSSMRFAILTSNEMRFVLLPSKHLLKHNQLFSYWLTIATKLLTPEVSKRHLEVWFDFSAVDHCFFCRVVEEIHFPQHLWATLVTGFLGLENLKINFATDHHSIALYRDVSEDDLKKFIACIL